MYRIVQLYNAIGHYKMWTVFIYEMLVRFLWSKLYKHMSLQEDMDDPSDFSNNVFKEDPKRSL